MNRRSFFGLLGAALAGSVLDPERLLWKPGAKLISIPAPVVDLPDWTVEIETGPSFISPRLLEAITKESLATLERNLKFTRQINQDFDQAFASGDLVGRLVSVRRPRKFVVANYPGVRI